MADKTVVVRLALKANGFTSGLRQAGGDVQSFATQVERGTTKASSSALALGAASATAGKLIILGIGGAMVVSAKAAIDYESSLAGVAKTTDLTGNAFDRASGPLASFGDTMRELSLRVPVNVNELNRIAELGGQLGVATPFLRSFTETIAALGVTTNLSVEKAATSLARLANIMGTPQSEFATIGGIVVELGNNFATTEAEIVNFGLRIAPVMETVGAGEDEVLALAAALTSLGVPAERGGTALQRLFIDMQQAVDQGGAKLERFAEVSQTSVEDFVETFRRAPSEAFRDFVRGLDTVNESGGNVFSVLKSLDVQQQRSIQVLLAAANGWETVGEAIEAAGTESKKAGDALFEEAARRYGTTASQLQLVANAFNDLRIEIGGAILGSGGLAAAIDFFREFLGLVKDNLPLIGRLAQALALLSAIRIGASFLAMAVNAQKSITALLNVSGALRGASAAMAATRLAALALNTALFGAIAIAGLLATKWAFAAIKAAELKTAARNLNEVISESDDPYQAIATALEEANILTDERREALLTLGISERDYISALMGEKDAIDEVTGGAETYSEKINAILVAQKRVGENGAWNDVSNAIFTVEEALGDGAELMSAFFEVKRNDIADALLDTEFGAGKTKEELQAAADAAIRLFGIEATPEDVVAGITPQRNDRPGRADYAREIEQIEKSWVDLITMREDGEKQFENFFKALEEIGSDFSDHMADSFEEVSDEIKGSFPVWDEYERTAIESTQAVLDAQTAYLDDLEDALELGSRISAGVFGDMSNSTLEWWNTLDVGTQAALARMNEKSSTEFKEFIGKVDDNMQRLDGIFVDEWQNRLPTIARDGFTQMIAEVTSVVEGLDLTGQASIDALMAGMQFELANLPENLRPLYVAQMESTFLDLDTLRGLGLSAADGMILGFIEGLGRLSGLTEGIINQELEEINTQIESKWDIDSPSKVSSFYGEMYAEGIIQGFQDRMSLFSSGDIAATLQPFTNPPISNGVTNNVNRTAKITINHPTSGDLKQDTQLASMMATQMVMAN